MRSAGRLAAISLWLIVLVSVCCLSLLALPIRAHPVGVGDVLQIGQTVAGVVDTLDKTKDEVGKFLEGLEPTKEPSPTLPTSGGVEEDDEDEEGEENDDNDAENESDNDSDEDEEPEETPQTPLNTPTPGPNILEELDQEIQNFDFNTAIGIVSDPENQTTIMIVVMTIGMLLCFGGYRMLTIWLFIAGFVATTLFFFIFLPSIFDTSVCCGRGTELVHGLISAGLGIVGGIFATFILTIGLFLTGCCFGFLCSMLVMATPLGEASMMGNSVSFVLVYLGSSLAGGILALIFQQIFVVITTSFGGSFAFFLALDSFVQTNFNLLAVAISERFKETVHLSPQGKPLSTDIDIGAGGYLMFSFWILMALGGILFQYKFLGIPSGSSANAPLSRENESVIVVVDNSRGRKKKQTVMKKAPPSGGFFGFFGGKKEPAYKEIATEGDSGSDSTDVENPIEAIKMEKYRSQSAKYKTKASKYKVELRKLQERLRIEHERKLEEDRKRVQEEERLLEMQQKLLEQRAQIARQQELEKKAKAKEEKRLRESPPTPPLHSPPLTASPPPPPLTRSLSTDSISSTSSDDVISD